MDDNHWTLAQTLFGVTTYYRNEPDGSLSIKMEGRLDGVSLFDQVAVLREVDLHYTWAPFVSSSLTVAHLNKLDTVGWFVIGLPSFGLMRDACFRAIGCDSMLEDGSILLVAQGLEDRPENGTPKYNVRQKSNGETSTTLEVDAAVAAAQEFEYLSKDPVLKELDLPEPPTRIGSGRMTIRAFQSLIHVESPESARTRIIANVDPNLPFIPQSLLDFLMKKLCGVLLNKLQSAAKRVSKDPINNPHASKMREEEEFYKNWLMVKFQAVAKLRNWNLVPVASFELSDQQMELAQDADEKKHRVKTKSTIRFYHSLSQDKLDHFLEADNASEPANIGQRSPKVRTMSEDSTISDISRNSSSSSFSFWQNNPLASYLRELEERTQLTKAREIERARERAVNRLKPKTLDKDTSKRLQELREARDRRQAGIKAEQIPQIPEDSTKSQRKLIRAQHKTDWATMWTGHGFLTRIVVMIVLVASLFTLLYMDPIFETYIANHDKTFWEKRGQDAATVGFMVLSALVHFCMCYVALMYAFSSLQIGAIAGREAKRFYSQNLHLALATSSFGMVFLSALKASLLVVTRWVIWETSRLFDLSTHAIGSIMSQLTTRLPESFNTIAESIRSGLGTISPYINTILEASTSSGVTALNGLYAIFIESNSLGGSIWKLFGAVVQQLNMCIKGFSGFVETSLGVYDGRVEVLTWREDAFGLTRSLLTNTGVFLLVLVTLFSLTARNPHSSGNLDTEEASTDDIGSISDSEHSKSRSSAHGPPALQESSSGSPDSVQQSAAAVRYRSRNMTRSLSPQFETIHEADEDCDGTVQPTGTRSQEPSPTKKSRGMRLLRGRKPSGTNGERPTSTRSSLSM